MVAWKRNLYAVWLSQIISMMGFGFVLPFLPFYIQELGVTDPASLRAWTGAISGAPGLLMGAVAPVWGHLADRYGRKLMLLRAMGAGTLLTAALGFAPSVQVVLVLRLGSGLFTGTIAASAALVAAATPREQLSRAMGLLASSTFIGYAMGPSIGGLCAEWLGYRMTFSIGAAILLTGFFLVLFFVEDSRESATSTGSQQTGIPFTMRTALRSPFAALFLTFFILRFARSLPFSFVPLYIQELRGTVVGSSALTGALAAAVGVLTGVCGLVFAPLGDRHDRMALLGLFVAAGAACALPIFFLRGAWGFVVPYVLSAMCLGPANPYLESTMAVLTTRGTRGVLFGVQAFMGSMAMFAAPVVGSLVTIGLTLKHIFLAFGLALVVAAAMAIWARRSTRRAATIPVQEVSPAAGAEA